MAGQSCEPRVDLPGFARSDPVDRRLHVMEDPTPRHSAQHTECLRIDTIAVRDVAETRTGILALLACLKPKGSPSPTSAAGDDPGLRKAIP